MYEVYTNTTIGSRHIDKGIVCQDFSDSFKDGNTIIAAVSDGHGSPQYFRSDRGSRFAVEAAIQCLSEFAGLFSEDPSAERKIPLSTLLNEDNRDEIMTQLYKSILSRWCEKVDRDYSENPFTEQDYEGLREKYVLKYQSGYYLSAYGATLIAVLMTGQYWLAIHIGDGKLVCIGSDCECSQPVPWDEDCEGAVTTSICQDDALNKFRYYLSTEPPMAICFGSDGIDDTYGDGDILHTFYKQLILEFAESGYENTANEIEELLPEITRNGSHDDVTVALIFDPDKVRERQEQLSLQIILSKNADELERLDSRLRRAERRAEILKKEIEALEAQRNTANESDDITDAPVADSGELSSETDIIFRYIIDSEDTENTEDNGNTEIIDGTDIFSSEDAIAAENTDMTEEKPDFELQSIGEIASEEQTDDEEDDEITQKIKAAKTDYEASLDIISSLNTEIERLKKESGEAKAAITSIKGE